METQTQSCIQELVPNRVANERRRRGQIERSHYSGAVSLHSFETDAKFYANLFVGMPFGNQLHDFTLPGGERPWFIVLSPA